MNSLAQPRINSASVANEGTKGFSDVMSDHQVSNIILFGGLVIINNEPTEQDDIADLVIRHDIGETLGPFVGN